MSIKESDVHAEAMPSLNHFPEHGSSPAPKTNSKARKRTSAKGFLKRISSTLVCAAVLIASVVIGITIGYELRVRDIGGETIAPENIFQGRTLSMALGLVTMDPNAGTASFAWQILSDSECNGTVNTTCTMVNVYFDSFLLPAGVSQSPLSNVRATTPIYQYQPYTQYNVDLYSAPLNSFSTSITLFPHNSTGSLQDYPFDRYETSVFLFARDSVTNATVGLLTVQQYGVVVGFEVSTSPGQPKHGWPPGAIFFNVLARRGVLVKAYAILIVLAVWCITLIFVAGTFYGVFCNYPMHLEFLAIPVATLFTVTQLRTTMPGAPEGFGAIMDYAGLLPCLALMSLCSVISIAGMAFTDPAEKRVTLAGILDRIVVPEHPKMTRSESVC